MNKPIKTLEKEIQKLKIRIFLSEAVVWIDILVVSVLISIYVQSLFETIYITNEDKTRLTTLILIGFVRSTVVHIANDAHFSKDLKLKKTEHNSRLAIDEEYEEPKEILINLLIPIVWLHINLLKILMSILINLLSFAEYVGSFFLKSKEKNKSEIVINDQANKQKKPSQKLEKEIRDINAEITLVRVFLIIGIVLILMPTIFFINDRDFNWLLCSLIPTCITLWKYNWYTDRSEKLKEMQIKYKGLQSSL